MQVFKANLKFLASCLKGLFVTKVFWSRAVLKTALGHRTEISTVLKKNSLLFLLCFFRYGKAVWCSSLFNQIMRGGGHKFGNKNIGIMEKNGKHRKLVKTIKV